eukprot:m.139518 g.139518  ORF g.139518 m.139518 type:complete len:58 (+) comp30063_c0_seq1:276-449(+)
MHVFIQKSNLVSVLIEEVFRSQNFIKIKTSFCWRWRDVHNVGVVEVITWRPLISVVI